MKEWGNAVKPMKIAMVFLVGTVLAVFLVLAGCGKPAEPEPEPTVKKLYELYPGDIGKADYAEIRSGSTGRLVKISDQAVIRSWINEIRDFDIVPDPNQEDRTGYLYAVSLYENDEAKLSFTTSSIGGYYYIFNEDLKEKIEALFNSAR
ncbi:hypothetical protein V3851_10635 [Paenibacillus sp. M1]|uniref:DUF4367 domain-containing protein n=1 Tax=Paenibacillus haidiansis TaxID=1574488 RepID=A0ABU7VTQ6_9BACL